MVKMVTARESLVEVMTTEGQCVCVCVCVCEVQGGLLIHKAWLDDGAMLEDDSVRSRKRASWAPLGALTFPDGKGLSLLGIH